MCFFNFQEKSENEIRKKVKKAKAVVQKKKATVQKKKAAIKKAQKKKPTKKLNVTSAKKARASLKRRAKR